MADRKYYVLCQSNCKYESMTKEQIIAAIAEATGKTPTDIDAAFISKIKEINKGATVQIWIGETAEYNALVANGEKRGDVIYIKTDDSALADLQNYFTQEINRVNNEVAQLEKDFAMSKSVFEADIHILQGQTEVNEENITTVATWVQDEQRVIYNLTWDRATNEITNGDEVAAQLYADITGGKNVEIRISDGTYNYIAVITDRSHCFISVLSPRFQYLHSWRVNASSIAFWKEHFIGNDAVIEEGTKGDWHYRKWASGVAECWARLGFWNETISNDNIKRFHYNIPFPFEFAEVPAVFAVASSIPDNELTNGYPDVNVINAVASKTQLQTVSVIGYVTSVTITEGFISIHANGRWK